MSEDGEGFVWLRENANKCCAELGIKEDLFLDIYQSDSDWAFIIKTDALLETVSKDFVSRTLKLEVKGRDIGADELEKFIRRLPVNGGTSLTKLLRASGLDADICEFIESIRKVRNAFAHDIHQVDASLLDVLQKHAEFSSLLRRLSFLQNFDEDEWVEMIKNDGGLIRHSILRQTLVYLTLGYHIVIKEMPAQEAT